MIVGVDHLNFEYKKTIRTRYWGQDASADVLALRKPLDSHTRPQ